MMEEAYNSQQKMSLRNKYIQQVIRLRMTNVNYPRFLNQLIIVRNIYVNLSKVQNLVDILREKIT